VDEWRRARKGPLPVEVAIDNLDLFLAIGLGQTPAVVTVTGDPE
jgi:hypothetical protein